MIEDRRDNKRVDVILEATWDSLSGANEARIADISLGGCFLNTVGQAQIGEKIHLKLKIPSGQWLHLTGEVTSYYPGIGFGLLFDPLDTEAEAAIHGLISAN